MTDVIPLYYDMKKATKEPITNSNLFKGLSLAYTGGNIGVYSNDISKIKNSSNMSLNSKSYNEALTCIKWLCLENNQTIDYAKTLYKSTRPDNVDSIIKKYTKEKLPHFFVYAKDKEETQVEKPNNSPVNRIRKLFPPKKINYNFKKENIGYFDYHVLMSNPNVERNQKVIETFKKLAKNIKHNITGYDKDGNYLPIITDIKNQMSALGYDNTYICDVLVKELFGTTKSADKRAFWHIYGDIVYENICNNINNNFIQCERCKKRFYIETHDQKYCKKCLKKISKLSLANKKILKCCDCGKEIEVDRRAVNKVRCDICQNNYRKNYLKKYFTNKS